MSARVECESLRIDLGGAPLVEGLSFVAEGRRVALLGDWHPLFSLLGRSAELRAGRATFDGCDAAEAVASGVVGLALRDPDLPRDWSSDRYWLEAALLGGATRKTALDLVRAVIASLGLGALQGRRIRDLDLAEQRGLGVGLALLESPPLLAVEDPFAGVDDRRADWLANVIERGAAGRALLLSSSAPPATGPEHALLARSDTALRLEAGALLGPGELTALLGSPHRYLVRVGENGAALATSLGERGLEVQVASVDRLVVGLTDSAQTDAILDAALAVRAPILELRPLGASPAGAP